MNMYSALIWPSLKFNNDQHTLNVIDCETSWIHMPLGLSQLAINKAMPIPNLKLNTVNRRNKNFWHIYISRQWKCVGGMDQEIHKNWSPRNLVMFNGGGALC